MVNTHFYMDLYSSHYYFLCFLSFFFTLGALVKKILETKKDYETSTSSKLKQVCALCSFQCR